MRTGALCPGFRWLLPVVLCVSQPRDACGQAPDAMSGDISRAALPPSFVENRGQWPDPVMFGFRADGVLAALEKHAITLQLSGDDGSGSIHVAPVRMTFEGASADVVLEAEGRQAASCSFYLGNDRSRWQRNVPLNTSVLYRGLYDCIDVRIRATGPEEEGGQGRLEYDVRIHAGSDLEGVVVRCDGAEALAIAPDGSLLLSTALGVLRQPLPKTWQERPSGEQVPIECRYRVVDATRFGFEVSPADPDLPTVIDPEIEWLTFLGGAGDEDVPEAIALGPDGTVTVAGFTDSVEFDWGCKDRPPDWVPSRGSYDWFVAQYSSGGELLHLVFLGGSSIDGAFALEVDGRGVITVAGQVWSEDFPKMDGPERAFQKDFAGGWGDGFLLQLSPEFEIIYSTYFGGSGEDAITGLKIDATGAVVLCGYTASGDLPVTPGAFQEDFRGGTYDAFVARIMPDPDLPRQDQLLYGTFLGGTEADTHPEIIDHRLVCQALDLNEAGEAVVTGSTWSEDFPITPGALQTEGDQGGDVYVSVLRPDTTIQPSNQQLRYSARFGGAQDDIPWDVKWDASGNRVCLVGMTDSDDFPTTEGAFQETFPADSRAAFVVRVTPDSSLPSEEQLAYSTYLGGSLRDAANGLFVMDSGDLLIGGTALSPDFPTTDGSVLRGPADLFLVRFNPDAENPLIYSTLIGGDSREGLFVGPDGDGTRVFVFAGNGSSTDLASRNACDRDFDGGSGDGFIARLLLSESVPFLRGDVTGNGKLGLDDAQTILMFQFASGVELDCPDAADVNNNGHVELIDTLTLLIYVFTPQATPPAAPFPDCGPDPRMDRLACEAHLYCGPSAQ